LPNNEDIKAVVLNQPTKAQSETTIKALCDYLSKVWYLPVESQQQKPAITDK